MTQTRLTPNRQLPIPKQFVSWEFLDVGYWKLGVDSVREMTMVIRGCALLALFAITAAGASAQEVASVGGLAPAPEQMRVRFQIAAMEGVLERAVQLGARRLSQQVQTVSPDMLVIAGSARARGFMLDGYGVF